MQAWQTWRVLRQDRPDIVFVQNPPIFSVLVAFLYARRYGLKYVIDSHTGAFLTLRWRWSLGLHRMLSRRAQTTIVHNKSQQEIVKRWGCRHCVIAFIPGDYSFREHFPLDGEFNVAVISTFQADEPLDVVFNAAGRLPDVTFYVTGDSNCAEPRFLAEAPDNCRITGYLTYEQYVGLVSEVDICLDLTTRNHTLLMGAFEAVSLGTPLIVSDSPILRDYFCLGTVYALNTVEGVCEAVRLAQRDHAALRRDILLLRERLQTEWEQNFAELRHLIHER
jgi:glycosyltransferase involved in cell wall biosynthesis